ncbi:MAG: hypothetical protein GX030_01295 [Firmicutes bacterium]|nr:hypothetical protein [Bacillota bacterium]
MNMKRILSLALTAVMVWTLAVPVGVSAQASPLQQLTELEKQLYGRPVEEGSIIERLGRLENDLFGRTERGALLVRLERLRSYVDATGINGNSLTVKLTALEWMMYQSVNSDKPLFDRIKELELGIFGSTNTGPVENRVQELTNIVWGGRDIATAVREVPSSTLVKIQLLAGVSSEKNKVNDQIPYEIIEDIIVDGTLVIPAGTKGTATVTEAREAGRLGRDGVLRLDFGRVTAIDGSRIRLVLSERASEENQSLYMAAGASMLGVVLLAGNPIGLAGALLVKGKDVSIDSNVEFYVEVATEAKVNGLVVSLGQN